jgi:hypothetical protein
VLLTYHLPELGTDLVAALSSLNVQNLTHVGDDERKTSRSGNKAEKNTTTTTTTQRSAQERNAEQRRREMSKEQSGKLFCGAKNRERNEKKRNRRRTREAGKNGKFTFVMYILVYTFHSFIHGSDG